EAVDRRGHAHGGGAQLDPVVAGEQHFVRPADGEDHRDGHRDRGKQRQGDGEGEPRLDRHFHGASSGRTRSLSRLRRRASRPCAGTTPTTYSLRRWWTSGGGGSTALSGMRITWCTASTSRPMRRCRLSATTIRLRGPISAG